MPVTASLGRGKPIAPARSRCKGLGMPALSAFDGATLAYHVFGEGPPLICLPGGPTDSVYLGDSAVSPHDAS
jgi:hypothetical protein